jgi:hypothetical protein
MFLPIAFLKLCFRAFSLQMTHIQSEPRLSGYSAVPTISVAGGLSAFLRAGPILDHHQFPLSLVLVFPLALPIFREA